MELNRNHRKTRILVSTKVPSTFHSIRSAIENKFKALTNQSYKLRYRLSQDGNSDLLALRGDADVSEAMSAAQKRSSSLQLFVQVNPGVFPSTSGQTVGNNDMTSGAYGSVGTAASFVHRPSVDAMRAARIDPADSESYTMISFYGFSDIAQPSEFAWQLETLWKPFHALGRVSTCLLSTVLFPSFLLLHILTVHTAGVRRKRRRERTNGGPHERAAVLFFGHAFFGHVPVAADQH